MSGHFEPSDLFREIAEINGCWEELAGSAAPPPAISTGNSPRPRVKEEQLATPPSVPLLEEVPVVKGEPQDVVNEEATEEEDNDDDIEDPDFLPGRGNGGELRRSGRKRKIRSRFSDDNDKPVHEGVRLKQRRISDSVLKTPAGRKRPIKMYEISQLADPAKERARQNAINAKNNRDRKKKQEEALKAENQRLRKLCDEVNGRAERAEAKVIELQEEMHALKERAELAELKVLESRSSADYMPDANISLEKWVLEMNEAEPMPFFE